MWKTILANVDKHRQLILDTLDYIWKNPESGYREWKTHAYLAKVFRDLGYDLTEAGNIPGFYTVLDTGRPGPEVLIFGELDSLIVPTHPECDPRTGAVHACGHAAQCAALVGIAAALREPGALDGLCGRIRLCAVPAEELIEIEYRMELQKKGIIRYLGGKTEFMHRGYLDGVDLAFMVHTTNGTDFSARSAQVGCMSKRVVYRGKSSHAGGSAVNAIPDYVVLESYIRGISFAAMADANRRVNRALTGAALSLGGNVDIQDTPGYAPTRQDPGLMDVAAEAARAIGYSFFRDPAPSTGSTDMGDVSQVMPALHPHCPGASGTSHGSDYRIADPDLACLTSAKWQVAMLHLLLGNGAARARDILAKFTPAFPSVRDYLNYIDGFACSGERITYTDTGAEVKL